MTDTTSPQFAQDDLFLRDADRERMALAYGALIAKRQSLLLASSSDVLLEHYGKMLVQQLRRHDDVQVEVYFPSSSEALIQRFNDVLAPMSLEDAVSTQGAGLPARILVLHDARSVQASQLELLARLVNDFPGANVRVVLLINTQSQLEKDLAAFGKRMSRWTIDVPDVEGGQAFLRQATLAGLEGPATVLLERLGLLDQDDDLLPDDTLDLAERDPAAEQALLQAVAQRAQASTDDSERANRVWGAKWLVLAVVLLLGVSAAAVVGLSDKYRQASLAAVQSWSDQLKALGASTEQASEEGAVEPGSAGEEARAQDAVEVGQDDLTERLAAALKADEQDQALRETEQPPQQQPPQAQVATDAGADGGDQAVVAGNEAGNEARDEVDVQTEPSATDAVWTSVRTDLQIEAAQRNVQAQAGDDVAASGRFAPVLQPPTAAEPAPVAAPAPQPQSSTASLPDGNSWVQQLAQTNWLIQCVSVSELGQAQQWIKDRPQLEGLQILAMLKRNNKQLHYVVVQGPHTTQARAQAFASRAESLKEYWIRTVRSVRGDMVQP